MSEKVLISGEIFPVEHKSKNYIYDTETENSSDEKQKYSHFLKPTHLRIYELESQHFD